MGAIVLAAGASQRMGVNKALLPIDGKPMLLGIVESLVAKSVVVVTGHEHQAIEILLKQAGVRLAYNPDHREAGMLSSVKVGLTALRGSADAIFIVLGDQPLVKPTTFQQLETKWRQTKATALR